MIIHRKDAYALIQPIGRLDLDGGIAIRETLAEVALGSHSSWVIDLTQVDFIDSAGLTALISGLSLATANQCRFKLLAPNPSVRLVLEITRLDQVFEIIDTAEALEAPASISSRLTNVRELATAA